MPRLMSLAFVATAVLGAMLAAPRALAQEAAEEQVETRLTARPLFMFNQYLYLGGMSRPRALAYDREKHELWVVDGTRVGVFRPDGAELYSFTSRDRLPDPARITMAPGGRVAILDTRRHAIGTFDYRGGYRGDVALPDLGGKPVVGAVAWDAAGNLYVGDNRGGEILVYRPDGSLKLRFGSKGEDEGQFQAICGIAFAPDGRIVVADQRAIAVQVFDGQGNFVAGWGRHEMGAANVSLPSGLAIDANGRVILSDELRHQVKVFDLDGHLLGQFGGLGSGLGQLAFPCDVAVGDDDRVYVAERTTARIHVFELGEEPVRPSRR
jgi:DNA-binding beta-propeller fold protein YncE